VWIDGIGINGVEPSGSATRIQQELTYQEIW
jgi:hypothetical protein